MIIKLIVSVKLNVCEAVSVREYVCEYACTSILTVEYYAAEHRTRLTSRTDKE